MRKDDYTFCTYRGHHHTLARGVPMTPILLEMVGKKGALMGGKGGSMHLTSVEHGAMGSYAIVGAHLPIALGAAWSAQYRKSGQVAVCFFGDGTTNIGAFHEALNMAAVWKAPVVFVCENNQYMEYTAIKDVTAVEHPAADRAASYGLESIVIDGNDPEAVYATARKYIDRARSGGGPALIECMTYRHGGHSRADPGTYRPKEEVAAWLARDPLPTYRARLVKDGISAAQLDEMDKEAARKVAEAEAAARSAPEPDPATTTPSSGAMAARRGDPPARRPEARPMAEMTYRAAVAAGIAQEMERDPNVVFLGEDVAAAGGVFKATGGLVIASGRTAFATHPSANRRSSARPWARR